VTNNLIVKSQLNISNSVLIVGGSFTFTPSSVTQLNGNTIINVGGCVEFAGTLILNSTSTQVNISYSCYNGNFSTIKMKNPMDNSTCAYPVYEEASMTVLFKQCSYSTQKHKLKPYIIAIICVAVVLVTISILFSILANPAVRRKVLPFRDRKKNLK